MADAATSKPAGTAATALTAATVVVRHVPPSQWTAVGVADLFAPFGPVTEVKLGPGRGTAFVTFKSPADAEEAEAVLRLLAENFQKLMRE